jgi:MFS family permease
MAGDSTSAAFTSSKVAIAPARSAPPGRYALVGGATLGTMLGATAVVAIPLGVMLVPIAESFGWSRTAIAGAFTALSLSQALAYPVGGLVADKFGARRTFLLGFVALAVSVILIAAAPATPLAFYGIFAVSGVAGVFCSAMVISKLLSEWFEERRGFWLGLVGGVGNGSAGMLMPAIVGLMVVSLGWRGSFASIGVAMLIAALPILFLTLKNPPVITAAAADPVMSGLTFRQAMRRPLFWVIFAAVPVGGGALTGVFANTVTVLNSQGVSTSMATFAVAIFALVTIVIEPLVGHILDLVDRPRRAAAFYVVAVIGLIVLAQANTPTTALLGCALTGFGLGAEFTVLPYLLSRYFGLREMGAISGVAYAGALVANGISPVILNASFDRLGYYAPGMYFVAGLIVFAFVVFILLPPFPDEGDLPKPAQP